MENLYTPNCIRTFTGKYVNVFEPNPETINIEDIAHALSMQCRFGAHLPKFYSVAQHSIDASELATKSNRLATLLHDASEAYLMDIPRPIKQKLTNYKKIEDNLMNVIASKFGFKYPFCVEVKLIDECMLKHEWSAFMLNENVVKKPILSIEEAKEKFLHYYNLFK